MSIIEVGWILTEQGEGRMASEEEAAEMMDTLKDLNLSKDVRIQVIHLLLSVASNLLGNEILFPYYKVCK